MRLVFLLEELSMKVFLDGLIPRLIDTGRVPVTMIPHEGKSDLKRSIPRKLRAWREPGARFIVVHDQDGGDCVALKDELAELCAEAGKPESVVRIACRELESWFIGDLVAVERAFARQGLAALQNQRVYRNPDRLGSPSQKLAELVPGYAKVSGARALGPVLDIERCTSPSFRGFVRAIRRVTGELEQSLGG